MRISVGAGTYVVAVSGGVDSMVLLDILRQRPGIKLVVAHYDHGIRKDSQVDRKLVQKVAKKHGLMFVHLEGKLGIKTSEAKARAARYAFLNNVKQASGAKAIITAHHQDDVLETAILNMLRGSGRRGLTSLRSVEGLVRPLVDYSKQQLRDYAEEHSLLWREDESNTDTTYVRNYVRANVLPKFSEGQRAQLVILLERLRDLNDELDARLVDLLHTQPALNQLDRAWFIHLPHDIAKEVTLAWLRRHNARDVTKKTIERLVVGMKTAKYGQYIDVDNRYKIHVKRDILALVPRDR